MKAKLASPLRHTELSTVQLKQDIPSSVIELNAIGSPIAVSLVVAQIIVSAFKSQSVRPNSHVRQEIRKEHPSLANGDASASVVWILPMSRLQTSSLHVLPSAIRRRAGKTVPCIGPQHRFVGKAHGSNSASTPISPGPNPARPTVIGGGSGIVCSRGLHR
jgi:hypothetical protein